MNADNQRGLADRSADQNQSDAKDVSRRKALGRLGLYTAPAVLALLTSEANAVTSSVG
jgi:hypothetical protein